MATDLITNIKTALATGCDCPGLEFQLEYLEELESHFKKFSAKVSHERNRSTLQSYLLVLTPALRYFPVGLLEAYLPQSMTCSLEGKKVKITCGFEGFSVDVWLKRILKPEERPVWARHLPSLTPEQEVIISIQCKTKLADQVAFKKASDTQQYSHLEACGLLMLMARCSADAPTKQQLARAALGMFLMDNHILLLTLVGQMAKALETAKTESPLYYVYLSKVADENHSLSLEDLAMYDQWLKPWCPQSILTYGKYLE